MNYEKSPLNFAQSLMIAMSLKAVSSTNMMSAGGNIVHAIGSGIGYLSMLPKITSSFLIKEANVAQTVADAIRPFTAEDYHERINNLQSLPETEIDFWSIKSVVSHTVDYMFKSTPAVWDLEYLPKITELTTEQYAYGHTAKGASDATHLFGGTQLTYEQYTSVKSIENSFMAKGISSQGNANVMYNKEAFSAEDFVKTALHEQIKNEFEEAKGGIVDSFLHTLATTVEYTGKAIEFESYLTSQLSMMLERGEDVLHMLADTMYPSIQTEAQIQNYISHFSFEEGHDMLIVDYIS